MSQAFYGGRFEFLSDGSVYIGPLEKTSAYPKELMNHNPDDITPDQRSRCKDVLSDVLDELKRAKEIYPRPAVSPAEGFFWLQEEFDELKEELYKSPSNRNFALMRKEAIQVAAMAIRFLQECCPKNI